MNVLFAHDNVYYPDESGSVYVAGQFAAEWWDIYCEVFNELHVIGRKGLLDKDSRRYNRSDRDGVSFTLLPNMNSPKGWLKHRTEVCRKVKENVESHDLIILRGVTEIGWLAYKHARKLNKPVVLELSGCPFDNMFYHGSLIGKFYAPLRYLRAKQVARNAVGILSVSHDFLPNRYPPGPNTKLAVASNVRLDAINSEITKARIQRLKIDVQGKTPMTIGLIGHLGHRLKGVHIAIKALAYVHQKLDGKRVVNLRILGPGDPAPWQEMAQKWRVADHVFFDGLRPSGQAVYDWLDDIDLYIQPSFHEGVPRASIEAMSRGLPVIGSNAGGIPELLERDDIHPKGSYKKLGRRMLEYIENRTLMIHSSENNACKAQEFTQDRLMPIRQKFYQDIKNAIKTQS